VNPNGLTTTVHFEYGLDSSLRGPGATGVVYDQRTAEQAVGGDSANHSVSATATGLLPNATYHVRVVATNAAGQAAGGDQTFKTATDPPPGPPVLGKSVNAFPVAGIVFVKAPPGASLSRAGAAAFVKGQGFIPLTEARQLPVGSQIDARAGTIELSSATTKAHKIQAGQFESGLFSVLQSRNKKLLGLTELDLLENAFPGAPSYSVCTATGKKTAFAGATDAKRKLPTTVVQLLRSKVHGHFVTRGRYSAATVRGTQWDEVDRCDGTLTVVHRGTVLVRDFRRRVTIAVHAGKRYLAKAP
jgi:hypothetical protein